jgi:hypothetical protein
MALALLGNKSIITSELFRYIFPHANVSYVDSLLPSKSDSPDETSHDPIFFDKDNNDYTQSCLDAIMAVISNNEVPNESCGGTTSYKTADGNVIFLTQAESYHHRGPAFANYSQLEFECIIQLQETTSLKMNCDENRGRKSRPGFQLGSSHPLYASHVGVIRMKMCTPMLAGTPPPQFPGNRPIDNESLNSKWNTNMMYYTKYLMNMCVPWKNKSLPFFERTPKGFCALINRWNSKSATFIERQRFRFLSNFMSKGHRNNHN